MKFSDWLLGENQEAKKYFENVEKYLLSINKKILLSELIKKIRKLPNSSDAGKGIPRIHWIPDDRSRSSTVQIEGSNTLIIYKNTSDWALFVDVDWEYNDNDGVDKRANNILINLPIKNSKIEHYPDNSLRWYKLRKPKIIEDEEETDYSGQDVSLYYIKNVKKYLEGLTGVHNIHKVMKKVSKIPGLKGLDTPDWTFNLKQKEYYVKIETVYGYWFLEFDAVLADEPASQFHQSVDWDKTEIPEMQFKTDKE